MVDYEIPSERLPEGFAERIERVPSDPAPARPAATIVLMREGAGLEILLLRRTRSAGFVPGAYVFPGGRVDAADASSELVARIKGLDRETAAHRLEIDDGAPEGIAYYLAALREAFEETGILVAYDDGLRPAGSAADHADLADLQDALLRDEISFDTVLDRAGHRLDGDAVAYIAHWVTPVVEPRRYDTRFFAAEVPPGTEPRLNPAEMNDGIWLSPEDALHRHRQGSLPMIFPTIRTLESLRGFGSPGEALEDFRKREIPVLMPKLVRTERGVGLELP
jgi:8-oxo-dGTP pyrophosphatase MutT (NUDIX family)